MARVLGERHEYCDTIILALFLLSPGAAAGVTIMSTSKHRTRYYEPLAPNRPVLLVRGNRVLNLQPSRVTADAVGQKACGLASIPHQWTKPFIIVSADTPPTVNAIGRALAKGGIEATRQVMVRSSGVRETISERGKLISSPCYPSQLVEHIHELRNRLKGEAGTGPDHVHWIVQSLVLSSTKGHLSNERRVSRQLRDWVVEVEAVHGYPLEVHSISIRPWRDARERSVDTLVCPYRANYLGCLEDVARWAYNRQRRIHFEWIWDGEAIYVVQADECEKDEFGVNPADFVASSRKTISVGTLTHFRTAVAADFEQYRKLENAKTYIGLGYKLPNFFVLADQTELRLLVVKGQCSDGLFTDLKALTARPLVLRTTGAHMPSGLRQMLPRSDELRSPEDAKTWLLGDFRKAIESNELLKYKPCLIAHHFIPSAASAWCQAHPDHRRVRIESL